MSGEEREKEERASLPLARPQATCLIMPVSSSVIMGLWWQWKVLTEDSSPARMG